MKNTFSLIFSPVLSAVSVAFPVAFSVTFPALVFAPMLAFAEYPPPALPDNSRSNQLEKNQDLNAQDQGNSKGDIEITRKIRQAVVARKAFSMDAKNIKIITVDGAVTLKGPVKTAGEKAQIERIAKNAAGKTKVTSQIEIEQ